MTRRFTSFQTLALWTTGITYLLILVGGLVRVSGAGLGCPDWPRCFGTWIPPLSAAALPPQFDPSQFNPQLMWTEYLNRLLGVTVGILIFATLISAWRHHRRTPAILWTTFAAFILVGFEGWLGGVVVAHELAAWIVTVHLIVALIIVSLLLYATAYAIIRPPAGRRRRLTPLVATTVLLMAVTVGQVVLGAQVRGHVDEALDANTPRANALSAAGALDYWHRDLGLVVFALTVVTILIVWNGVGTHERVAPARALRRTAHAVTALVALQLGAGVLMAYGGLPPAAQVAHLVLAALLLGAQTLLLLLARWQMVDEY